MAVQKEAFSLNSRKSAADRFIYAGLQSALNVKSKNDERKDCFCIHQIKLKEKSGG